MRGALELGDPRVGGGQLGRQVGHLLLGLCAAGSERVALRLEPGRRLGYRSGRHWRNASTKVRESTALLSISTGDMLRRRILIRQLR